MQPYRHIGACLAVAVVLFGTVARADDATPSKGGVALELNAADLVGEACRITFVATNTGTAPIDRAVYETVLFGADGAVMMLTLFDFGALPAGVPRVRQFQIADTACGRIGADQRGRDMHRGRRGVRGLHQGAGDLQPSEHRIARIRPCLICHGFRAFTIWAALWSLFWWGSRF